jgi:hypothetical protein
MVSSFPLMWPVNYIIDSLGECRHCRKAKRTVLTWLFIMGGALGFGAWAGIIFWVVGEQVGIEIYRMANAMRLPVILGATAYLWWIYWQYSKLFCECE